MDIHIIEPIGQPEAVIRARFEHWPPGHRLSFADTRGLDDPALIERIQGADVLALSNRPLTAAVIAACHRLKLISVAFTGLDHIDLAACQARGVQVRNAAGYAVHAVSELAIGLMIALLRRLPQADATVRAGGDSRALLGGELAGKTLGVVGCGAIGLQVARLGVAFGCRVLGVNNGPVQADDVALEQVDLDELLSRSDIVSLHTPLTEETRGLIGRDQLARMKPSAILINTARGPVVEQAALAEALAQGRIAGAGIDVFDREPPLPPDHPLLTAPNVLLTPHIGFDTVEAVAAKADIALRHVEEFLQRAA